MWVMLRRWAPEKTGLSSFRCFLCWVPTVVSTPGPRNSFKSLEKVSGHAVELNEAGLEGTYLDGVTDLV